MIIPELEMEQNRLLLRAQSFAQEVDSLYICTSAFQEVKELHDYMIAGYPPLMHDWVLAMWEAHPYSHEG